MTNDWANFQNEQGLGDRKKYIGGSDIASILGISPYKTSYQLRLEKTGKVESKDISNLPHVRRGIVAEPIARDLVNKKLGREFKALRMVGAEPWMVANVDGIDSKGLLEIKTMSLDKHNEVASGKIPPYYECQLEWYCAISEKESCVFASYRPEDGTLNMMTYWTNKELQNRILQEARAFWNHIIQNEPPEVPESDHELCMESDMLEAAVEYKRLSEELKDIETKIKNLRDILVSKEVPLLVGGLKITPYFRKGNVDYSKIEALKNINLDAYRKPSTLNWRISG